MTADIVLPIHYGQAAYRPALATPTTKRLVVLASLRWLDGCGLDERQQAEVYAALPDLDVVTRLAILNAIADVNEVSWAWDHGDREVDGLRITEADAIDSSAQAEMLAAHALAVNGPALACCDHEVHPLSLLSAYAGGRVVVASEPRPALWETRAQAVKA